MQFLEIGTNRVLVDFTDSPKLYDFTPRFIDAKRQRYRRNDQQLVTNDAKPTKRSSPLSSEGSHRLRSIGLKRFTDNAKTLSVSLTR